MDSLKRWGVRAAGCVSSGPPKGAVEGTGGAVPRTSTVHLLLNTQHI
jgi:hypothetical protein